ncbi:MAG: enoyl-ACP reductase [Gammaproteobacteria bacterium]|nr:enoyl-ACP reductase [Gammaproteobacteria bacterium]
MGFLQGKRALIVGIASNRSIAYGVAKAMHREGAELAFTFQTEKLKSRVEEVAAECGSDIVLPLDVASDAQIDEAFAVLSQRWDGLDCIIHSVAYAPREQLEGSYVDAVTREGFRVAHDISAYSFAALAKAGRSLMKGRNGALLTMSYLGAVRVVPNYNVMGVAAAAGIANFKTMLAEAEKKVPLRRNVTIDEVGNAAAFLCSDLASGITGDVLYVDSGYHILGM